MSEAKLTPWFPVSVKPVRIGLYQVIVKSGSIWDEKQPYSHWNGITFNWVSIDSGFAHAMRHDSGAGDWVRRWRGLAEEPKQ